MRSGLWSGPCSTIPARRRKRRFRTGSLAANDCAGAAPNPDIEFRLKAICSRSKLKTLRSPGSQRFYAIVNIPAESLPLAFRRNARVLNPNGLLLLSFHIGDEVISPEELWGNRVSMEFYQLQPERIRRLLANAGFVIEDVIERDPYAADVEFQSRRAYVYARRPSSRELTRVARRGGDSACDAFIHSALQNGLVHGLIEISFHSLRRNARSWCWGGACGKHCAGVVASGLYAHRAESGMHGIGLGETRHALLCSVVHNQAGAVAGSWTFVFLEQIDFERVNFFLGAGT